MEPKDAVLVRWFIKLSSWAAASISLAASADFEPLQLAPLLLAIAADAADARFGRSGSSLAAKSALMAIVAVAYPALAPLLASAGFDLAYGGPAAVAALAPIAAAVAAGRGPGAAAAAASAASGAAAAVGAAWLAGRYDASLGRYTAALDAERAARLRLEDAARRLERASAELVGAAERSERARIARDIHDEAGHRLTGALVQLRAARFLSETQPSRAAPMLDSAIGALSEALDSLRETVHDLRPRPESDAAALRRLAAEFRFCPVSLSFDERRFAALREAVREACVGAVRELLTNAARHSQAGAITISIAQEEGGRIRLSYADDGIGASRVREGLGLAGIRSRVEALGGAVTVSGELGFKLYCVIPTGALDA